ncbi:AAA domain-containing protein [Coprinopsis sp. MPI-PUGE-AT-0042]|nr:AAA domain-containing protein [Coprinopsis sp. MPI-PUGE-AT-0042]
MSSLHKLAIRGIRSFDDKQLLVIEFFSPVTVIVGHNGSGKTTIIECLKYATTGEQPPNTRGGAFVHDPKMANEKEVKAQVKLRFTAANGTSMLAVRNLSVTVKKTAGLTMKTLENILALESNGTTGKRAVISTKCAELDAEIPQLLGVSKAVLENVIFCHQEDSYWPLAEPSVLKKKFDEIFEATKYTKALDNIKSLRKDRVAELKTEEEKLKSFKVSKDRADKLRIRMKELNSTIASKEVEYESARDQHQEAAESNRKFYEYGTKFREIYLKVEALEEKKNDKQRDLEEAREGAYHELNGTDEELASRLNQFDAHVEKQREKLRKEERTRQDFEDDAAKLRQQELDLSQKKAHFEAEASNQANRIVEREQLIQDISKQFGLPAVSSSQPTDKAQVAQFLTRISDLKRKQTTDAENLRTEIESKGDEYSRKLEKLKLEVETFKLQKNSLKEQLSERNVAIRQAQRQLDEQPTLQTNLSDHHEEMEEKQTRIEKLKKEIMAAKHEKRLQEKMEQARQLEETREALMEETRALSSQADSRAKLDLKRTEIKTKTLEVQTVLKTSAVKYRDVTGRDLEEDAAEAHVDEDIRLKEEELAGCERDLQAASSSLHTLDGEAKSLNVQLAAKLSESHRHGERLASTLSEFDDKNVTAALRVAEADLEKALLAEVDASSAAKLFGKIKETGNKAHICLGCNRPLDPDELYDFNQHVDQRIAQSNKPAKAKAGEESLYTVAEYQEEIKALNEMKAVEDTKLALDHKEIPGIRQRLEEKEAARPALVKKVESLSDHVDACKTAIKSLISLKQLVSTIVRLKKDIEKAKKDAHDLETDLSLTGTAKTVDDVQAELNDITSQLRSIEKERQNISAERERQTAALHTFESRLQDLKLEEQRLANRLAETEKLSAQVEQMRKDVGTFTTNLRDLDSKIADASAPMQALDEERRSVLQDLNSRLTQGQTQLGQLNARADKLGVVNKDIERYIREKRDRGLEECTTEIKRCKEEQAEVNEKVHACRDAIRAIEKEINEAGASQGNLRENLRVRKLQKEILDIQAEIESHDVEEAAKARKNFQDQWAEKKQKEEELNNTAHTVAGELSSFKSQRTTLENDLKEFKNINKAYTEQLVKVKISDMANSDLEKYAKALDNAIMKYHSLKMEEVNDTMKHLWNKTYQGTDIDGIKIESGVEGGASKRSYNYRVVMTKDQVEMDMRGRCSAGQKMLASIIIRLALSDSFGQNCGILALDEPTNALDTENIDALAESLVDIINERKSHSNFQLLIITHDENFLRKLGQSDVMEYYWRVSRDSRQKSVIERQRFR